MNLVIFSQEVEMLTKQIFKVISKTEENCKLFEKCICDNITK